MSSRIYDAHTEAQATPPVLAILTTIGYTGRIERHVLAHIEIDVDNRGNVTRLTWRDLPGLRSSLEHVTPTMIASIRTREITDADELDALIDAIDE